MKRTRKRSMPRKAVCAAPPIVLAQPMVRRIRKRAGGPVSRRKSIRLRCPRDRAQPLCRVGRPTLSNVIVSRDMRGDTGLEQVWREAGAGLQRTPAASYPLSAQRVSRGPEPGEWRGVEPWCRQPFKAYGEGASAACRAGELCSTISPLRLSLFGIVITLAHLC